MTTSSDLARIVCSIAEEVARFGGLDTTTADTIEQTFEHGFDGVSDLSLLPKDLKVRDSQTSSQRPHRNTIDRINVVL